MGTRPITLPCGWKQEVGGTGKFVNKRTGDSTSVQPQVYTFVPEAQYLKYYNHRSLPPHKGRGKRVGSLEGWVAYVIDEEERMTFYNGKRVTKFYKNDITKLWQYEYPGIGLISYGTRRRLAEGHPVFRRLLRKLRAN